MRSQPGVQVRSTETTTTAEVRCSCGASVAFALASDEAIYPARSAPLGEQRTREASCGECGKVSVMRVLVVGK